MEAKQQGNAEPKRPAAVGDGPRARPGRSRSARRIRASGTGEGQAVTALSTGHDRHVARQRVRGQAAVIIGLAIVLLIFLLGLAIDGGSMYNQRRVAQNSADAAALAAARQMLSAPNGFDNMVLNNAVDIDGDSSLDASINLTITNFANLHGVDRNNLEAYYVDGDKRIVSTVQVGSLHSVPWASSGVKGITVRNRAVTDSFFMKMFGWNQVGARASSSAFMGVAVDSGAGVPVLPVGLFTDTTHLNNLTLGQTYTLIDGDMDLGSGNWGWINFNGSGTSASTLQAWLDCGFDPRLSSDNQWDQWCPSQSNVNNAMGPTLHYQCADHPDCLTPVPDPIYVNYLKFGPGDQGWWLLGSSGTAMSNCHDLQEFVVSGKHYVVPVFDHQIGGGSNIQYHLIGLAKFNLVDSSVDCNYHPPTPTPCAGCPTPTPTSSQTWHIEGIYEGLYVSGASGGPGDLRHTSLRTVYLDN